MGGVESEVFWVDGLRFLVFGIGDLMVHRAYVRSLAIVQLDGCLSRVCTARPIY